MVEFCERVQHYVSMSHALLNADVHFMTFANFHLHYGASSFFRFAQNVYVIYHANLGAFYTN